MNPYCTIGVDPGISGAIAIYDPDLNLVDVIDFPLIATKRTGRRVVRNEIDEHTLADWVEGRNGHTRSAYVEQVSSMPKQGVSSTFRFGMAYGIIRGILTAKKVPYQLVTPRKWKGMMGVGRDKDECRLQASRMFPAQSHLFSRKKDANRAEAVLIAVYGHKHG